MGNTSCHIFINITNNSLINLVFVLDECHGDAEEALELCWLQGDSQLYFFLIPVAISLFFNLIVFGVLLKIAIFRRQEVNNIITDLYHIGRPVYVIEGNAIGAASLWFDYRVGQIGCNVAKSSSLLQRFFGAAFCRR